MPHEGYRVDFRMILEAPCRVSDTKTIQSHGKKSEDLTGEGLERLLRRAERATDMSGGSEQWREAEHPNSLARFGRKA